LTPVTRRRRTEDDAWASSSAAEAPPKTRRDVRERHYLHEAWRKEQLDGIDFPVMTSV
jgi:hypothetical protein